VLDLAVEHKIVQKSGAWFSYGDQRLGQGRENVRQFLRDNPELVQQLRREVIQAVNPEWSGSAGSAPPAGPAAHAGGADGAEAAEAPAAESAVAGGGGTAE